MLTQPTLIRHPWLRQRLFGTSGPEIAGALMGISRNTNPLPKSQIHSTFRFYASRSYSKPSFESEQFKWISLCSEKGGYDYFFIIGDGSTA
ncbi:MAG: hypothetical protein J6D02_13950 [Lachnospira sp.]|nr:hypothetical protein [Lachnospira sp.]